MADGGTCPTCSGVHLAERAPFAPLDRVRVRLGLGYPEEGMIGTVMEWRTMGGPMWIRVRFDLPGVGHEQSGKATYHPCQLEEAPARAAGLSVLHMADALYLVLDAIRYADRTRPSETLAQLKKLADETFEQRSW